MDGEKLFVRISNPNDLQLILRTGADGYIHLSLNGVSYGAVQRGPNGNMVVNGALPQFLMVEALAVLAIVRCNRDEAVIKTKIKRLITN